MANGNVSDADIQAIIKQLQRVPTQEEDLTRQIRSLRRDIGFVRGRRGAQTSQALRARGITGGLAQAEARAAGVESTLGLRRQLENLRARRGQVRASGRLNELLASLRQTQDITGQGQAPRSATQPQSLLGTIERSPISRFRGGKALSGFQLSVPQGAGGLVGTRQFRTLDELISFLRSPQGAPLAGRVAIGGLDIGGLPSAGSLTPKELSKLGDLAQLTTRAQARQAIGRKAQPRGVAQALTEFGALATTEGPSRQLARSLGLGRARPTQSRQITTVDSREQQLREAATAAGLNADEVISVAKSLGRA